MQRRTFSGDCVAWDFWECKACGARTPTKSLCPCDQRRARDERRVARITRRSRTKRVEDRASLRIWLSIIKHDPCSYCGRRYAAADHVLAVAEGGSSEWDNLAPACRACNSSKGTRHALAFIAGTETR